MDVLPWLEALARPLVAMFQPEQRIFWPWLLLSAPLGLAVCVLRMRGWESGWSLFRTQFLSRALWTGASARLDVKLMVVNGLVKLVASAPLILPLAFVSALVTSLLELPTGGGLELLIPSWSITTLYTIAMFVVGDMSRFLLHRWMHLSPRLWKVHQVHHSATSMNPLTVYRVHPIESFLFGLRGVLAGGLVTGVFIWLFGNQLSGWDILGVNVLGMLFNALGANLRHSHVWWGYGPVLEKWLISPAQHQLHHSYASQHFNQNYGTCLSCWDRLTGTLLLSENESEVEFGVDDVPLDERHRLRDALLMPFR